ncbi:MAG: hypothetical protein QM635_01490 [Microbacteriaceae bacterium]
MTQEKWLVDEPRTIEIDAPVRRLKVSLIAGRVDIVGHDEPTARIEVHAVSGKELKIALVDDTLTIDHPQLSWENWIETFRAFRGRARADVSVLVPRAVAVTFGVVSAQALITGLDGDASIATVSGDVVVDGLSGDIQLNSVSGELAVQSHRGRVGARSVSGDITAAGEISRYASDTVSGEVFLDLAGVPDTVGLNSVSGDATVRLGAGVPARYRINTVSGRLQLDDSTVSGVRGSYSGRHGELAGAFVELKASSVSGNVSVLHAVTA